MQPVRWGIISTANIFTKALAIPLRQSPLSEVVAIASRDTATAEAAARRHGIPTAYGSYEALLADPSVEAVYIPVPNHLHLPLILAAADAGKHILCEKPLALNADDARKATSYAASKGVLLMEAFMYRFHPQWVRVRELIASDQIGTVQAVHAWFTYSNADPKNIRNIRDMGGGALYDIGCYAVSAARFAFGREPQRVLSLVSRDPGLGTDILSSGILDFAPGQATFTVGTQSFPHQRVEILGRGGSISIAIPFNTPGDVPAQVTVTTGVTSRTLQMGPADMYRLEVDAFSLAVRQGGPVPTPIEDAVANMAVLDALFDSERSGVWELVRH